MTYYTSVNCSRDASSRQRLLSGIHPLPIIVRHTVATMQAVPGSLIVPRILLVFAILGFGWVHDAQANDCRREIQPIVSELNHRIKSLQSMVPSSGQGKQVPVGSCSSRLAKLAGNLLCCKTFENIAPVWEEIGCLELKKFYLKKTCECAGTSDGFTTDELLQDSVYEQYEAIKILRKRALNRGIKNNAIRAYVSEAQKSLDCMNVNSLAVLRRISIQLERLLDE